jgi:cytochrome b pre-mRNA-processing protein 3
MGLLERLLRRNADVPAAELYKAVVARGRAPHWYLDGGVADTIDGRFDMIAAVLAMVLLRVEADPDGAAPGAALAERFVDDMDGQLREIGIGDVVVGKHVSKMMGMLGGRLGAYRNGIEAGDLGPALVRNLYRGNAPTASALAQVRDQLIAFRGALDAVPLDALLAGRLPQ